MGLLGTVLKIAVGVALAGAAIYLTVKVINKQTIKKKLREEIENNEDFRDAFKAKIVKKSQNSISLDVLSSWDSVVAEDVQIKGEKIADDIRVGTEIPIYD